MNSNTIRKLTVALRERYPFFSFITVTPAGIVMMPSRQTDGTICFDVPKLDDFDRRICLWYKLTEAEWIGLSDDAQHRLIDRYTDTQNLIADREVERQLACQLRAHEAAHAALQAASKAKRVRKTTTKTKG